MDRVYADTVRLMLAVAPDVFAGGDFAMKGDTAINLFVRDLPRLSVDIDVVFTPWEPPRAEALAIIAARLAAAGRRLTAAGLDVRLMARRGLGESKLVVKGADAQVKVEVNAVYDGDDCAAPPVPSPVRRSGKSAVGRPDLQRTEHAMPVTRHSPPTPYGRCTRSRLCSRGWSPRPAPKECRC